jgi:hypothetical protein
MHPIPILHVSVTFYASKCLLSFSICQKALVGTAGTAGPWNELTLVIFIKEDDQHQVPWTRRTRRTRRTDTRFSFSSGASSETVPV